MIQLNESQLELLDKNDIELSMKEVILNSRKTPLALEDFQNYLKYKYCEENLLFLLHVNKLIQILDKNIQNDINYFENNNFSTELEILYSDYIVDGAEFQINLCNNSRKIATDGKENLFNNVDNWILLKEKFKQIIEPATKEIENLLLSDQFPGFIRHATKINLSETEALRRQLIGILFLFVGIIMTLILWLGIDEYKESMYYRISTFIPYFSSISMLLSSYCQL